MGFNQAIKDMKTSGERFGVFLPHVKVKHFTGDAAIAFRILPAYAYGKTPDGRTVPMSPVAWEPFRRPSGDFTEWGNTIQLSRGVGHGKDYKSGTRKDIISPKTFDPDAVCPLTMLYQAAAQYPEWQYLIEDQKMPDGKVVNRAALTKPGKLLVMNVVDVGDPQTSGIVQLGAFTKSAYDSLFATNGLAVAPSPAASAEMVAQNYLLQWAYGDITDPNTGPVLLCMKVKGQGQFSKYNISLMADSQNQVRRWPLGEAYLQQRYDLANLETIVARDTEQEIIGMLCQLMNMRGPHGRHEWHLLKDVFGQIANIPNPPENAPAASPTVQSGFAAPTTGGYGQPPMQGPAPMAGFGPGQAAPAPMGAFGPGQAAPAPMAGYGPGQAIPMGPPATGPAPMQYAAPAAAPAPFAAAPAPTAAPAPYMAPVAPAAGPATAAAVGPAVAAAAAAMPVTPGPTVGAPAPTAPGDNLGQQLVPGTTQTREQFLASLKTPGQG